MKQPKITPQTPCSTEEVLQIRRGVDEVEHSVFLVLIGPSKNSHITIILIIIMIIIIEVR